MEPDRIILAADSSTAWSQAVGLLLEQPDHSSINLLIRITDPLAEDPDIRAHVDHMLRQRNGRDVTEIANTIFPTEWAIDFPEPEALTTDYLEHYPLLKEIDGANRRGTYFGRMVAYPMGPRDDSLDQLSLTVSKLREGLQKNDLYHAIYQLNIYHPGRDGKVKRGFPCLAHVGLYIDANRRLHATAHYRSHDVATKGYGNYIGLGGLQKYVADAAGLERGELTILAGRAFLGPPLAPVRSAYARLRKNL